MRLKKYQKEYGRFNKMSRKAYKILINLYNEVSGDEKLKAKKDLSSILNTLEYYQSNYFEILDDINNVDFINVKDIKLQKLNNLLILPLFEDEDIYVPADSQISDIFNT